MEPTGERRTDRDRDGLLTLRLKDTEPTVSERPPLEPKEVSLALASPESENESHLKLLGSSRHESGDVISGPYFLLSLGRVEPAPSLTDVCVKLCTVLSQRQDTGEHGPGVVRLTWCAAHGVAPFHEHASGTPVLNSLQRHCPKLVLNEPQITEVLLAGRGAPRELGRLFELNDQREEAVLGRPLPSRMGLLVLWHKG